MQSAWEVRKPIPSPVTAWTAPAVDGSFKISRVFSRALGVLGPNIITILALIGLAAVPERAITHFAGLDEKYLDVVSKATLVLSGLALQLALMRMTFGSTSGGRAGFGECVAQAFKSYLPVLAIGMLAILPMVAATLLFAVPGVMLATAWTMAVPIRVAESTTIFACFSRSVAMTKGHRWKIVAIFALVGLALAPVLLALQPLWGIPLAGHAQFFAVNWLARLLLSAVCGLVLACVYLELRQSAEV